MFFIGCLFLVAAFEIVRQGQSKRILFIIKFCAVILISVIGLNYKEICVKNLFCNKT